MPCRRPAGARAAAPSTSAVGTLPSMPLFDVRTRPSGALDAQQRGAVTRGLAWQWTEQGSSVTEQVKAAMSYHPQRPPARPFIWTRAVHGRQVPSARFCRMRDEGGLDTVVGGVDLTWARWDTETRTAAEQAARTSICGARRTGARRWTELLTSRPAASDVGNVFAGRWNDDPPKPGSRGTCKVAVKSPWCHSRRPPRSQGRTTFRCFSRPRAATGASTAPRSKSTPGRRWAIARSTHSS